MMRRISTPDSVEKNEPTVLAIVETVLAVAAYWGIAWWFDTHWHLLFSICVAPLLLLRSPESTEEGVRWFLGNGENKTRFSLLLFTVVITVVIAAASTYKMAHVLLTDRNGWMLFFWA
ncbi:MAG: hypothetical protein KJO08_11000, partial [Gammaproteobacteria bacterium]|nr:hypothetical protein [Gammaproteobacteria bacterium]